MNRADSNPAGDPEAPGRDAASREAAARGEDAVCDWIVRDAEALRGSGDRPELARYVRAIPDIARRPAALDTAIEAAIDAMIARGSSAEHAARQLLESYPEFAPAIRTAAFLREAIYSTQSIVAGGVQPVVRLPAGIGPAWMHRPHRYELIERIASGAQGCVYRAVDHAVSAADRPTMVAIKVLHPATDRAIDFLEDESEGVRARRIVHPGVVRVLDRGESDTGRFIVFDLVEGETLDDYVKGRGGRLTQREAARLAGLIAEGIGAAHAAGVVHRDLKPSNVLIEASGVPRITDFGIGVSAHELAKAEDLARGALAFIAPEQFRRESAGVEAGVDVYALGALLYWMLSGRLPNGESAFAIGEALAAGAAGEWPPMGEDLWRHVDSDLRAICRKAMARRREDRYASASALAGDLERFLEREVIAWRRPSISRRAWLGFRRAPRLWLATAAAIVGAAGAAVVFMQARVTRDLAEVQHQADLRVERSGREAALAAKSREDERIRQGGRVGGILQVVLAQLSSAEVTERYIPLLYAMEALGSEKVLADDNLRKTAAIRRAELLDRIVTQAAAEGRANDVESMFWESQLGVHLMRVECYEDAARVLGINVRRWERVLEPEDRWLRSMRAAAIAARLRAWPEAGEAEGLRTELLSLGPESLQEPFRKLAMEAAQRAAQSAEPMVAKATPRR